MTILLIITGGIIASAALALLVGNAIHYGMGDDEQPIRKRESLPSDIPQRQRRVSE